MSRESSGGGSVGAGASAGGSGRTGRAGSSGGSEGRFVSAAWCVIKPGKTE